MHIKFNNILKVVKTFMFILLALFVFDFTMQGKSSNIQIVFGTVSYSTINPHGCKTFIFFINSSKCPIFNTCVGTDRPLTWLNCADGATMTT
jgi:hypothetical protein